MWSTNSEWSTFYGFIAACLILNHTNSPGNLAHYFTEHQTDFRVDGNQKIIGDLPMVIDSSPASLYCPFFNNSVACKTFHKETYLILETISGTKYVKIVLF